jgi:hypothetical protein
MQLGDGMFGRRWEVMAHLYKKKVERFCKEVVGKRDNFAANCDAG